MQAAVASVLCASLLDAAPTALTSIVESPVAWHLADPTGRPVVCLCTPAAVRLPHAIIVSRLPERGAALWVGGGDVGWDGSSYPVLRWFAPDRPVLPELRSRLDATAVTQLISGWRRHVGLGPGLTPYGDDVVCGALIAARAAGQPRLDAVAALLVEAPLERLTTAPSAALLRLAAGGWCIPQLATWLRALAGGGNLAEASNALRAVGHSSGRGLLAGATVALPRRATGDAEAA
ncbi:MAG: DUF2877 domain-containing protein [Sciscionella sp.]